MGVFGNEATQRTGQVSLIGRHAWSMYLNLLGSRLCLSNLIEKVISNKSHFLILNYTSGSIVVFGTSVAIHCVLIGLVATFFW